MTITIPKTQLEVVLQRAGASDKDRAAWLAQRAQGVTATDMRELMLGNITMEQLADKKLGRIPDDFAGNAYTAWGNEREPIIAAVVEARFAIRPESRVFHAVDDPRKLASPDGLAEDFAGDIVSSEIKTGDEKYDLAPGGVDFEAKGYEWQVLWNLRVLGGVRSLYTWEGRRGRPGAFEVGDLSHAWVERDEAKIARMEAVADRFLEVLAERANLPFSEPTVDEVIDTHAVNYLRFIQEENDAAAAKKAEYDAILEAVGERESFQQVGATARVTLTPMKVATRVEYDVEAAKKANPDLFAEMTVAQELWQQHLEGFATEVQTETKPRVTITPVKQKETNA